MVAGWRELRSRYDAPEVGELTDRMTALAEGGTQTSETFARVGEVLSELVDGLRLLEWRRSVLADEAARGASGAAFARTDLDVTVARLRSNIAGVLDEACRDLAGLAAPPPLPLAAVGGTGPLTGPRITWQVQTERAAREIVLAPLVEAARGGAGRVRTLLADHPEWADRIRRRPPAPGEIRDWWSSLTSAARTALTNGAPNVVGALGGVPPLDRVAANRVVARDRVALVDRDIAHYEALLTDGTMATLRTERQSTLDRLTAERAYLERVVAGDVQLVLYQPEENRIAEMIGTPGPATQRVLTYVPGTFTSVQSFYRGGAQAMPAWLVGQDAEMVAFAWKGTEFPGDNEGHEWSDQLNGILEANGSSRALPAGETLAQFMGEMRSDPAVGHARQIGAGYSWGLVPLTGSEAVGTHYDSIHSFAGAWIPREWTADPTTSYFHWSYTDFLSMAQDAGLVGEGRNPDVTAPFDKHVYDRPGDYDVPLGGDLAPFVDPDGPSFRGSFSPVRNHDLVVDVSPENFPLLNSLSEEMFR
ncbi:hypothetical protein [Microbacterium sp. 22296]|uniref:hypothetical protein n=1 Tax=Microbacterium sp. 22296 TaxID=3453903 RepID=UPI003F846DB6